MGESLKRRNSKDPGSVGLRGRDSQKLLDVSHRARYFAIPLDVAMFQVNGGEAMKTNTGKLILTSTIVVLLCVGVRPGTASGKEYLFQDGFESGDTSVWALIVP